jgi:hypothetical protein
MRMISSSEPLGVLSLLPGRVRLHLPGWTGSDTDRIEDRVHRVQGVESVQANPLTGNALIFFDCRTTREVTVMVELQAAWDSWRAEQECMQPPRSKTPPRTDILPPVECPSQAASSWIRVGVRGLLGHAIVDSLWFAAGFVGNSFGLPLAGLGPLHILMDLAVWGIALSSGTRSSAPRQESGPASPLSAAARSRSCGEGSPPIRAAWNGG